MSGWTVLTILLTSPIWLSFIAIMCASCIAGVVAWGYAMLLLFREFKNGWA